MDKMSSKAAMVELHRRADMPAKFINIWPRIRDLLGDGLAVRIEEGDPYAYLFFSENFPQASISGASILHGAEDFLSENTELYPGSELVKIGLLSLGKEWDGSQFCYSSNDFAVYHLSICPGNASEARAEAFQYWVSLSAFLAWFENNL